ncbi:hypothetical protein ACFY6U_25105 [Streptomyces sp. NPDC013157]|uniref:Rv1733c family protein n=1 Tax=Streptomyces sp. NPDC013157 TaxID=3364861 RepID=UPI003676B7B7
MPSGKYARKWLWRWRSNPLRRHDGIVLLDDVPRATPAIGTTTDRRATTVRWTTADGATHTGRTLADAGLKAGSEVTVWQDRAGRLASAPPDPTEAAIESGALGTAAAAALGGLVFGGGAVARRLLDRRRIEEWGREWALVGPRWGDKTS